MIKIDLVSGFLGAGKTTFIKKMINEAYAGEKIALIENEFGEVGIDGGFLRESGVQITEINSGCICCSLVGDFAENLREVIASYHPERIIIEPSGVGKLSDVMQSVIDLQEEQDVRLNALVTVVNAKKARKQMKAFGEFFNNQIAFASVLVLSRTQDLSPEETELCARGLRGLNPDAALITTPWDEISGRQILAVLEGKDTLEQQMMAREKQHRHEHEHEHKHEHEHEHDHGHHHHHADEIFISWGRETPRQFTEAQIQAALKELSEGSAYGEVLRAKGMVENKEGGWIYFDMVPGEYEIRKGEPDYTGRLCVIGVHIDEQGLDRLFGLA